MNIDPGFGSLKTCAPVGAYELASDAAQALARLGCARDRLAAIEHLAGELAGFAVDAGLAPKERRELWARLSNELRDREADEVEADLARGGLAPSPAGPHPGGGA